jgi:hypothetical protein
MKKLGWLFLAVTVSMLIAGGHASAQNVGDRSVYFVTYFSNANTAGAPDGTLRLINDGDNATSQSNGHIANGALYASIYTFDDSQQMQECCNCYISADGILSESIDRNLMSNTLTGGREETSRGVIKILSGTNNDPTNNVLKAGLHGTMTHIQVVPGTYSVTETPLADANLVGVEQQDLQITCGFVMYLGSGQGICSCTPEDSDF